MNWKLVTINGPLGVGKSWTANRVKELVAAKTAVHFVSFQDPLKKAVMALLGVSESQISYDDFKKTVYHGFTGREWMIKMSEDFAKRVGGHQFFSKVMHERMKSIVSNPQMKHLFIADSNGFESELDYFKVQSDVDLLSTSIEPEEYKDRRGKVYFEGDSRFNLAHKCGLVREDSTQMAHAIVEALNRRGWV